MIRRIALVVAATALAWRPLAAQLEMITVPRGLLRIDLSGDFFPTDNLFLGGVRMPLGSLLTSSNLDASATPMIGALESSLTKILGQPATGATLGAINTIAEQQRGVGTIGLGLGVTRRLSLFATLPLVYLRTRTIVNYNPANANVGINPADPILGTADARAQTNSFIAAFGAALDTLASNVAKGSYAADPSTLALAQQTLSSGPVLRSTLRALLTDAGTASAVLPTATSAEGAALLSAIAQVENTFSTRLGITGFTGTPALPQAALSAPGFDSLLGSSTGFGLRTSDLPHWALGDITTGATYELIHRESVDGGLLGAWAEATVRYPTGERANLGLLFDQPGGPGEPAVDVAGTVEVRRHGVGIRGELRFEDQLAWNELERLGTPEQLLVPAQFTAAISHKPGDIIQLTARPYVQLAPHLAIAGFAQYWRKGSDRNAYIAGQVAIGGIDPSVLDVNTAGSMLQLGIGLNYSHDGRSASGANTMPVEAGFSVQRIVVAGGGLVPDPLTSQLYFRIYKPIFKP